MLYKSRRKVLVQRHDATRSHRWYGYCTDVPRREARLRKTRVRFHNRSGATCADLHLYVGLAGLDLAANRPSRTYEGVHRDTRDTREREHVR